jgi:hypothetical protein
MDDDLKGAATQVRVVQGKEPTHFLTIFKGKMIIYSGGTASAFKNKSDADSYDTDGTSLFHVKGTNANNTRAVQIEESASRLNSGDAFILKTPETVFCWYGKGCSADERKAAKVLAEQMKNGTMFRTVTEVEEGSETTKFWGFIGGKQEYATTKDMSEAPRDPRLYSCSNATGQVVVEEIFDFCQDDLDNSDVFLLDVWSEVYVWLGKNANPDEKKQGMTVAQQFVQKSGTRSADTPIVLVPSGQEPPMFTSAFLGWDTTIAAGYEDPYEKKLRLLKEASGGASSSSSSSAPAAAPAAVEVTNYANPETTKFSYEDLKKKPAAVNPADREQYLSDAEFATVFKMSRAEFNNQKQWKKDQLKKDKGLF